MLSVLITCYNQYDIVSKNVNNIISNNKDLNIEVIVSDDYSTDGSYEKLISEFSDNTDVKIIKPIKNMGVSNNRNTLFNAAKKKYCLFIDGDDIQSNDYIRNIYTVLDDDDIYYIKSFTEVWADDNLIEKESLRYDNVFLYVFKTSCIKDKFFREELEIGEDVEFGARYHDYIVSGKTIIDVSYLLNRRDDNVSLTKNGDINLRYKRDEKLLDYIIQYEDTSDDLLNGKINQKKIDLINIGMLIDLKPNISHVNTRNVSTKHKLSYYLYVILSKLRLQGMYKYFVKKFIGYKI